MITKLDKLRVIDLQNLAKSRCIKGYPATNRCVKKQVE